MQATELTGRPGRRARRDMRTSTPGFFLAPVPDRADRGCRTSVGGMRAPPGQPESAQDMGDILREISRLEGRRHARPRRRARSTGRGAIDIRGTPRVDPESQLAHVVEQRQPGTAPVSRSNVRLKFAEPRSRHPDRPPSGPDSRQARILVGPPPPGGQRDRQARAHVHQVQARISR